MRTALVKAGIDPSEMLEKSELQAACKKLLEGLPPLLVRSPHQHAQP